MNLKYFEMARLVAQTMPKKRQDGIRNKFRVVAILIPRVGNEVFIGTNKMDKMHAGSPHPYKSIHAEFDVLLKVGRGPRAKHKIKDADVYIYRETSYGQGLAKPCTSCFGELISRGVRRIYYSDADGFYSYTKGKIDGAV